ncbi:MAG: extracellular solute-binding protein [candidate division Zixibacteria bacterium]|nr:extracellular solute-binding protein [candidate division Zixibacteria bacterium]
MFRKLIYIVISALLLFSCGGNGDGGKTKLVFKVGKVAGQSGYLAQIVEEFENENPGVDVVLEILPSITDQQHQFYITSLEGGSSDFDVFALDVIWVPEFALAGWLESLEGKFTDEQLANFLPGPLKADTYNGELYAVPWYVDGGVLYYREDLLQKYNVKPPDTFAGLKQAARKIMKGEDNSKLAGFIWQGKQYEGLVCSALEFIEGNCAGILDDGGNPVINSERAIEALAFMKQLIDDGIAPEYVTTTDEEATRHSFGNGNVIFMRNWPYAYNIFNTEGSKVKDKVAVKTMPHFEGCESASTLGGWQLGINKFSKHKDWAWKFIEFMSRYETQKKMALNVGLKPSRKDVYSDEDLVKQQPFMAELLNTLLQAVPRPVSPYYPQISLVLQAKFSEVLSGSSSAEQALNEAQTRLTEIINRRK